MSVRLADELRVDLGVSWLEDATPHRQRAGNVGLGRLHREVAYLKPRLHPARDRQRLLVGSDEPMPCRAVPLQLGDRPRDQLLSVAVAGLEVYVEPDSVADGLERLGEGRDPLTPVGLVEPCAGIERLDLGQRQVRNSTAAVGRPVHAAVVDHGEPAFTGQAHVELDRLYAKGHGLAKRDLGVLGVPAGEAPVSDHVDFFVLGSHRRA